MSLINAIYGLTTFTGLLVFCLTSNKSSILDEEVQISFQKNVSNIQQKKNFIQRVLSITNRKKWDIYEILIAGFLFVLGFVIRIYHLGNLGLWWDELYTGTYVQRILETGLPTFPSNIGFYWRGVAYHYFVVVFIKIFGNTEFWLRFPSVLFGLGIIALCYLYARKIDKKIAIFILLFLTLSTYNVEYSRFARFYVMNAFLFTYSIYTFYEGYFEQKLVYKIVTSGLVVLMVYTVQLSSIFLSLVGSYFLYGIKNLFLEENRTIKYFGQNAKDIALMVIYTALLLGGNLLAKFAVIQSPFPTAIDAGLALPETPWKLIDLPKWRLFSFFNENYIPFFLIAISIAVFSYYFFASKRKKPSFINFVGVSTFISIVLYEIGSRGEYGPRIYLMEDGIICCITIVGLYILLKTLEVRKNVRYIYSGFVVILLVIGIRPNFIERVTTDYGDSVIDDAFRTTTVAAFRPDNKTTYEFVARNKKDQDIVISLIVPNYYYLRQNPSYIFNQNIRWNSDTRINAQSQFLDTASSAIAINTVSDLKKYISQNRGKKIWLIVNGASLKILQTTHVRADFIDFLNQNEDKRVYSSQDNASRVLLFEN